MKGSPTRIKLIECARVTDKFHRKYVITYIALVISYLSMVKQSMALKVLIE